MTDKEKIDKLKKLGWAMYHAAFNLTNNTARLRQTMRDWYNFINFELNKE